MLRDRCIVENVDGRRWWERGLSEREKRREEKARVVAVEFACLDGREVDEGRLWRHLTVQLVVGGVRVFEG